MTKEEILSEINGHIFILCSKIDNLNEHNNGNAFDKLLTGYNITSLRTQLKVWYDVKRLFNEGCK